MVDTTFIGHLIKKDDEPVNSGNLELLISQEFFEAGKFKNKQLPLFAKNEELVKVSCNKSYFISRNIKIQAVSFRSTPPQSVLCVT